MIKTFTEFLAKEQERSNAIINQYISEINNDGSIPAYLKDAIIYAVSGEGKRLRPALVRLGYECCSDYSKNDTEKKFLEDIAAEVAKRGALAIELIHTYSLVHDDLPAMDNDSLRRGRETCHIKFDEATAILIGDSLLNQAFEILLAPYDESLLNQFSPEELAQFLSGLQRLVFMLGRAAGPAGMIGGQILDMQSEKSKISLDELKQLHRFKTGKLIHAALSIIPVFYNYQDLMAVLGNYAEHVGLAYQVVDDILDVTASTEELGKSGTDEKNEKSTFVKLIGLEDSRSFAGELITKSKDILSEVSDQRAKRATNNKKSVSEENIQFLVGFSDFVLKRSF